MTDRINLFVKTIAKTKTKMGY